MKRIKLNTVLNILLVSAVIFFAQSRMNRNRTEETEQNELIRYVSKHLNRQETETRNRINTIETRIETLKQNDTLILKRIETSENNYKNIIKNLKSINDDKTKNDLEIIHTDSDADWDWFNRRFPKSKSDHRLSTETDTPVREQVKDGQHESH